MKTINKEPLWNKNFILLLQGQLFSIFGDNIYDIALRVWILSKTGSTAIMGLFMAISVVPRIVISPFAGTFIDRHNRKIILISCDMICAMTLLFTGMLAKLDLLQLWMVVSTGIIVGICGCFFNPTINSILPDIVPKSKLLKANSVVSLISTSDDMMGNAFGGFLVQIVGAPISFLLNGFSFLISAVSEMFMMVPKIEIKSKKVNFFQDLKEGLLFISKSKGLRYIYILTCFCNFVASMSMTLTLPLFKENINLGLGLYGVSMAINGAGMFLGFSLLSAIDIKTEKRFKFFILSGVIISLTMIFYSLTTNFYLISVLFFINGFCLAVNNSLTQSSIQVTVPDNMRSKALAFQRTLSSALMPAGMVIAGLLAEIVKINFIILVDYIIFFLLFLYTSRLLKVKNIINMLDI
jgi:MFS family permease